MIVQLLEADAESCVCMPCMQYALNHNRVSHSLHKYRVGAIEMTDVRLSK